MRPEVAPFARPVAPPALDPSNYPSQDRCCRTHGQTLTRLLLHRAAQHQPMSLREDVTKVASLLGIEVVTLPQAIEEANQMMGIRGEGPLPTQVHALLEACNSTTETVKAELDDGGAVVPSAVAIGRDFSGRGDWSAHVDNADDDLAMLPNMQVASSFLEKNSQAHTSAMTALGDIVDNARESGATSLSIEVVEGLDAERGRRGAANSRVLKVSDNGAGMSEGRVLEGMISIGYTHKDFSTGATNPHLLPMHRTAPLRTTPRRSSPLLTAPHRSSPHLTAPHRSSPQPSAHPRTLCQRGTRATSPSACGRKGRGTGGLACR